MRKIKKLLPLALAITALVFCACSGKPGMPSKTPAPTSSPKPAASAPASTEASAEPSEPPVTSGSPEASGSPGASASPNGSEKTGMISGFERFAEGEVADPESMPELEKLLKEDARFRDMSIQSVTFKMHEERRALYVVLQGDGDASHPVYVFEDGSVLDAD